MWRCLILIASVTVPAVGQSGDADAPIDFNRQIRPILSDKCFRCHGPDAGQRQAGLRLDQPEVALHELESGATAIVPSDPDSSELVRRIYADDEAERMPPADSQKSLSPAEKDLLKAWIAQGAKFSRHWSFVPPVRSAASPVPGDRWSHNDIDRFVLRRLQGEGLAPSPEADRRTLIRRVSFDLTGLPPTNAEVDAFLSDDRSDAYERVVDRLLASTRFGERMAVHWLDLARYADTDGYEKDGHRQMWPYRDWVINAFNANKPFDEFTIEQLAGDLLPAATRDQIIATAFNRNNPTTSEAGSDPAEFAAKYAVDRLNTTASTWLGLTTQCAECHDHKFDPITTEDFYRLFAFFNQLAEVPLYEGPEAPPSITVAMPEQEAALAKLDEQIAAAKAELEKEVNALVATQPQWEDQQRKPQLGAVDRRDGLAIECTFDEKDGELCFDSSGQNHHGKLVRLRSAADSAARRMVGVAGRAWQFDGNGWIECAAALPVDAHEGLSYAAWAKPTQRGGVVLSKIDPVNGSRGFDVYLQEGQAIVHIIDNWPLAAFKLKTKATYVPDQWMHVLVTWDGRSSRDAIRIYFNGQAQETITDVDGPPVVSIDNAAPVRIGSRADGENAFHGQIDEVRVYHRALTQQEAVALIERTAHQLLAIPAGQRGAEQARVLTDYYRRTAVAAATAQQRESLTALETKAAATRAQIPKVRIMQATAERRPTYILVRGDYLNPGKEVTAGIPAVFGDLPGDAPIDRLALARWLVSSKNPLTARVVVNRLWALCFGTGLVPTLNDFGSQGEWPSHPDLLDWLATEFVRQNWDIKSMMRAIVTSRTYCQSSRVTPDLLRQDPQNRLLARGPRVRLPAEMIRDNALAISGLLQEQVGGPSTFTYHPAGLWEEMAWADSPWKTWPQDRDTNLYRRGLYTFWKRSVLHPVMSLFDAPTRNVCEVGRSITNTPLQAYVTLNETSFVEAARALAARMMRERGGRPEDMIEYGYVLAIARPPSQQECNILHNVYLKMRDHYAQTADDAKDLLGVGESSNPNELDPIEHAAWTTVAQVILNLDETMTKE
ncbi:MAG: DUF1553 domain-containing protein [Pirellulales bacterium]